jgi:excinuclease ABC subunit C
MEVNENLKHTLSILPRKPGVYLFKDMKGRIIYVGKAKNLFDRVKSYFLSNDSANYINHPITFFTSKIDSVDFIETDNEVEALILESSLIKKNRPKYNFNLKDDKSYPFVAVTDNEKFPRVFITRNKNIRGAKYYGPYINIKNTRNTLETLRRIFQVRDCKKPKPGKVKNAVCLNYHINLCSAPCMGRISEKSYRQNIEYIKLFLKRGENAIVDNLKSEMESFALKQEFEEAAKVKYAIEAIEEMLTAQRISFASYDTWDILAAAMDTKSNMAAVSLYNYREGELAAVNNFFISNVMLLDEKEIISGFLKSYYLEPDNISPVIYIPFAIEEVEAISKWLSDMKGKKIEIRVARQDDKKNIVRMASKNAFLYLEKKKFEKSSGYSRAFKELLRLKEEIGLVNIPSRIECFDISNIGPSFAVGSMSVFTNASPLTSNYRHFKIRTVEGQDDFAMIAEVVSRRLNYLTASTVDIEDSFYMRPQLIIIDGGKAQYNAAKKVFEEKNIDDIDLISIAKKEEIIFSDNHPDGLSLDRHSDHMKIVIKIRDEAHRFALNYHKKLRSKYMTRSVLDGIKGIGEKKRALVLEKFEDIEDLKACKLDDFIKIKGLSYTDALNIYNSLNRY